MEDKNIIVRGQGTEPQSLPVDLIKNQPEKVQEILGQLSVSDQVLTIMPMKSEDQYALLMLSPNSREVIQAMPEEQVYQLIKDIGEKTSLPVIACASPDQVQFFFDIEWWQGDKFQPQKALDWFLLLDQCEEPKIVDWFLTEEFEQKVMVLQSLITVYKDDEMTDSYLGVDDLPHIDLDGVYDIFIKIPDAEIPLRKAFKLLAAEDKKVFYALLEAVIWYPVTQTVEDAYRWRLTRVGEKGIPDFEEAFEVYSRLNPESLNLPVPTDNDFTDEDSKHTVAPYFPMFDADPASFLGQCLTRLNDQQRLNNICWELVYLANKIIVADRADPSNRDTRHELMRKALAYINIGLEFGSGEDPAKGEKLLRSTWMQSLFQVGYGKIMQLREQAHQVIKENGDWLKNILNPSQLDHLTALVYRFPKIGVIQEGNENQHEKPILSWRDIKSAKDIETLENFLLRIKFNLRLVRKVLNFTEKKLDDLITNVDYPEVKGEIDMTHLLTTALARHSLFQEISCEPLTAEAANAFLEIIFIANIYQDEAKVCNDKLIESFQNILMKGNMAWIDQDKEFLKQMMHEVKINIESQLGGLNPKGSIDWQYTKGLLIKLQRH
jgi:hypothetical protein